MLESKTDESLPFASLDLLYNELGFSAIQTLNVLKRIYRFEDMKDISPIEREFVFFIRKWISGQMKNFSISGVMSDRKKSIATIMDLKSDEGGEDEFSAMKQLIMSEKEEAHRKIFGILMENLLKEYAILGDNEKSFVQNIIRQATVSTHVVAIGTALLLSEVGKEGGTKDFVGSDKIEPINTKPSWLKNAFSLIHNIYANIQIIKSVLDTKGPQNNALVGDFKKVFISELERMCQETFATISAMGCHMYREDCSVLFQPVMVKYCPSDGKQKTPEEKNVIRCKIKEEIVSIITYLEDTESFPWLTKWLKNPENQSKMIKGLYIHTPLIIDAKDIEKYLVTMNDFFEAFAGRLENPTTKKKFFIDVTRPEDIRLGNNKGQPRIKFEYTTKHGETFNMRLDYNKGKLELDVGGVSYLLKTGTILDVLKVQQSIKIIKNSYALGKNTQTARIMDNENYELENRMALVHSAMMQQGQKILGRREHIFGYHYELMDSLTESEFASIGRLFLKK